MNRRTMLKLMSLGGATVAAAGVVLREGVARAMAAGSKLVTIVDFSPQGVRGEVSDVEKVVKSEGEWRQLLSPISFDVTRKAGTERPFSGATWNLHDKGIYRCICCDTALFTADTKFESGTGWPSFWQPLDKRNIVERPDMSFGMDRTGGVPEG